MRCLVPAGRIKRARADELLAALKQQASKGDELQKQLRAFRDKLKAPPPSTDAPAAAK
jgi:hypothetical protein